MRYDRGQGPIPILPGGTGEVDQAIDHHRAGGCQRCPEGTIARDEPQVYPHTDQRRRHVNARDKAHPGVDLKRVEVQAEGRVEVASGGKHRQEDARTGIPVSEQRNGDRLGQKEADGESGKRQDGVQMALRQ